MSKVTMAAAVVLSLGRFAAASAQTPDTIAFNPGTPSLDNPTTPSGTGTASVLSLDLTAYDANGNVLAPSPSNPLYVKVYGAATGVISPSERKLTSGTTTTFNYNGKYFRNNLTVEAWIYDSNAGIPSGQPGAVQGGFAIGVTQIVPQTRLVCNCGTSSYSLNASAGPPDQFLIKEAVGYTDATTAAQNYKDYTVDTGSLGLLTPLLELPQIQPAPTANAEVIGPGPAGVQYYDSSGNTFSGYYYLAPVTFETAAGGAAQTIPIAVLAVNQAYCMGPTTKSCYKSPPQNPRPCTTWGSATIASRW